MCLHLLFAKLLVVTKKSCYPCSGKPQHNAIVEAKDPFKMAPTSISNIYKVFNYFHMMWMSRCVCNYHDSAALVCQAFGCHLEFLLPP
jgi:hypothetical protein